LGRRANDIRLLSVFRLAAAESKGMHILVQACDELRRQGTDVRLTVAGIGPVPDLMRRLAGERPWLSIVVSPNFGELTRLYSTADLFVLATQDEAVRSPGFGGEGFGIVLIEAQAAGLPVVAPFRGGSSDAFIVEFT